MKNFTLLFLFLSILYCSTSASANPLSKPRIEKISNQVYVLLGPVGIPSKENRGYMVNSTVIIGEKGVILIDTGFTDEIGRHIKSAISRLSNKPVTHIINTHHHGDHVLGNSEFKDAEIISTKNCKELVKTTAYEWIQLVENMTGSSYPNTRPILASKVYQQNTRTRVTLQGVALELWAPAGSHTSGDMMVFLPKEKILIAGDILVHTMTPSFRDAHVKTWINTLKLISEMDIDSIIPGHGPVMNLNDVSKMYSLMKNLYRGVEAGYRKGLTDSDIRKTLDLHEWKKMTNFEELMGININRTYLEVEEANF